MGKDISPFVRCILIAVLSVGVLFTGSNVQASIEKLPEYPQKGQLSLPEISAARLNSGRVTYRIKQGDVLISILKGYGVSEGDALTAAKRIDRKTLRKIKPGGMLDLAYNRDRTAIFEIGYTFENEKRKVLYSGNGLSIPVSSGSLATAKNLKKTVGITSETKKTSVVASFRPHDAGPGKTGRFASGSSTMGKNMRLLPAEDFILGREYIPGPAEIATADLEFIPGMVPWDIPDKSYDLSEENCPDSIFNASRYVKNKLRNDMYMERMKILRARLAVKKEFLKAPVAYRKITSRFAWRINPITGNPEHHTGVDYAAPYGTPVKAIGYGKVIFTGWRSGYGETIQIRHYDGYISQYAHLSRFGKGITRGKSVKRGDIIGYVGSSGMSTGPHLDFRVMKSGTYVNPLTLNKTPKHKNTKKYSSHKIRSKQNSVASSRRRSKSDVASRK